MILYIFDQPVPARKFAEKLGILKDCKTHLCCRNDSIVVFTNGQLFEFQEAGEYDREYIKWDRNDLPLKIGELVRIPIEKQKAKIKILEEFVKKAQKVFHAGSPDPEGQSAIDDLLRHCEYKGELVRLWNRDDIVSSGNIVPEKTNRQFGKFCRVRGDTNWRINENMRRGLSCMLNAAGVRLNVSYDYLSTAALGMIVERERQTTDSEDIFYTVRALVNGVPVWSKPVSGEKEASILCEKIKKEQGIINNYGVCDRIESPPAPHDFTSMSVEAEQLYSISPFESYLIANELYENGFISYPNVDSRKLPSSLFSRSRQILSSLFGMEGAAQANPSLKSECFDEMDALSHHAIIPLECPWQKLQGKKLKVFRIIAKRYIQQFYPDKKYREQELSVDFGGEILSAVGEIVDVPGWSDLSDSDIFEIPKFRKGDIVSSDIVNIQKASLSRFSGAELLSAMSRIERFELDEDYRKLVDEDSRLGFGRDKIRILQFLKDRQYIDIDNGQIIPTKMGKNFISWLPVKLYSPALASIEEKRLRDEEWSDNSEKKEISRVNEMMDDWLSEIDKFMVNGERKQNLVCPKCGMDIVERIWHKDHYYWQCMNQNCGRKFNDYKGRCIMPVKCLKCGKQSVERYKRKDGETYYWFCSECKKYYDDNDGKLVPQLECPVCGEVSVQRYESRNKPGIFYWHCKNRECGKRFSDDNGKIGRKFRDENEKAECPDCGGAAYRYESKKKAGEFYWSCSNCKNFFTDENGKIGHNRENDLKHDKCPVCGGVALQFVSAKGLPYWRCKSDNTHGPFSDENGRPGTAFGEHKTSGLEEADCPHCDGKAYKTESRNKPGTFFWRCKNCGLMSDENGAPGNIFSAKK